MNPEPTDQISGPGRSRTGRRLAVAGAVGAALAVGGVAVAQASAAPAPPSASASPSASGSAAPAAPGRDGRERTPRLAGTVESASGNTITITDRAGFRRTIHTTSATTYSDGLTATPAAGTAILAEGTVDSDRTSLLATRVGALPDRPEGGRHGRGGPGGRHGDRPGGPDGTATPVPPGSGTPTPAPSSPSPSPTG